MSLPWLKEDYKKQANQARSKSRSKSRSRSSSRTRHSGKVDTKKSRSRSRSRSRSKSNGRDRSRRGGFRGRGRGSDNRSRGGRSPERGSNRRRHRSDSSSSGSHKSNSRSPTRLVASERPKYVNARVFVANILSKDVTKVMLSNHFEKYGNVVDVLIHAKNYAFIQYLKEDHAKLAVEGENGSVFNGMRIDVKMANENRKDGANRSTRGGRGGGAAGKGGPDRDHMMSGNPNRDPYGPDPYMHGGRLPPPFPPLPGDFGPRDPFFPDPYRRPFPPEPWLDDPYRRDPYPDPFRDPYPSRAPSPPPECVVFYVNRQLQNYAESVERKVKDQSIIAISAIIPEGRTSSQMIEELSSRGGLFAIFINAQNETHRSLTLNILHGTPQEHRNMPLDDAIALVGRSFEKYVEELRAKANNTNNATAAPKPAELVPPPSEINYLLNLLADKQALTIQELDSVILYLQKRRDKLIETEKGPQALNVPPPTMNRPGDDQRFDSRKASEHPPDVQYGSRSPPKNVDRRYPGGEGSGGYAYREPHDREYPPPNDKYEHQIGDKHAPSGSKPSHEELTKKILSIFQGSESNEVHSLSAPPVTAPGPTPAPAPAPPPAPVSAASSANLINFDNPNVQKALDNLIQSGPNLLKNITPKMSSASTSLATSYGHSNMQPDMSSVHQSMSHSDPGMMDPHRSQAMYGSMDPNMQGSVANMAMAMQVPPHSSMAQMMNPLQQMVNYMMPGMGMPPPGGPAYANPQPPLPRGSAPPPPPPPQQHY